jgi:hypothetical protein
MTGPILHQKGSGWFHLDGVQTKYTINVNINSPTVNVDAIVIRRRDELE